MHLDPESCYRAVKSRDRRFDGVFYIAVRTTGIYCRPSCPARTPGVRERHLPPDRGGRPGRRLPRLQALPARRDTGQPRLGRRRRRRRPGDAADRRRRGRPRRRRRAGRAGRLHLPPPDPHPHPGARRRPARAGPRQARPDRAGAARDHRARRSPTSPSRPGSPACGSSTTRSARSTPRRRPQLRGRRGRGSTGGTVQLRLAVRTPFAGRALLDFLATTRRAGDRGRRAADWYTRTLRLPHGTGHRRASSSPTRPRPARPRSCPRRSGSTTCATSSAAVERVRRLLDADCDPVAVGDAFAGDPLLGAARAGDAGPARARARRRRRARGARRARPAGDAWPRPAPRRRGWSRRTAQPLPSPASADEPSRPPTCSRRPSAWPSSTPRRCRCRAPAAAPWSRCAARWPTARCGSTVAPTATTVRESLLGDPRHRPVDRRLHRPARTGPPRRVPAHRHRDPRRAARARARSRRRRAPRGRLEPVALLRPAATCGTPSDPPVVEEVVQRPLETTRKDTDMWTLMDSPIGELRIVEQDGAITAIEFSPFRDHDGRPRGDRDDTSPVLAETVRQLRRLLRPRPQGVRPARSRRPAPTSSSRSGPSWSRIGYGETASYGEIAQRLGTHQRRLAGGRPGQRQQPDPDRDPVPPGDRGRRHPHRLRRRASSASRRCSSSSRTRCSDRSARGPGHGP